MMKGKHTLEVGEYLFSVEVYSDDKISKSFVSVYGEFSVYFKETNYLGGDKSFLCETALLFAKGSKNNKYLRSSSYVCID